MQTISDTISLGERTLLAPSPPSVKPVPACRTGKDARWALLSARRQALSANSVETVAWLVMGLGSLAVLGISLWQALHGVSL